MHNASSPVKAIIVGAGHRALLYASYAHKFPESLQIVGVADPDPQRRTQAATMFNLTPEQCYVSAEEIAAQPKQADCIINGTMDHQHVPTSIPLLNAGYAMLLEKPFATHHGEMTQLIQAARKSKQILMICHVLRYAPFYSEIRKRIQENAIGTILSIQTKEHVSYHHMAVGFIRGKWSNTTHCHSSMLMAKCCHDLDLIMWMKSGIPPVSVSSFGSLMYFRKEHAPKHAGTRCLVDCPIEEQCLYSAKKHYLDHPERWAFYVWDALESLEKPSLQDKINLLKSDSPYARCVWKSDNNVVDHQSVLIEFNDGSIATHSLVGGSARPMREIHIVGTHGEIQGRFEDSQFVIRTIDPSPGNEYQEEWIDLSISGDMTGAFGGHGGGDMRLVHDFVEVLKGNTPSISYTSIEDSIASHLVGFAADDARIAREVKIIKPI